MECGEEREKGREERGEKEEERMGTECRKQGASEIKDIIV